MNRKLLGLHGLKFNPFSAEAPTASYWKPPALESFCWRIEQQIAEGGFSLILGDPGTGKSSALRILRQQLENTPELVIGVLTRPQASLADFYRELGELFGVPLSPHNRWNSAKVLREKWLAHMEASLYRPLLLIDEAQEMNPSVFGELRLLSSADLDSRSILTIVLCGDSRLSHRLQGTELVPIASRVRSRLRTEALAPAMLHQCLSHMLKAAGNAKLFSPSVSKTLCEHAMGNLRLLMNMANDLLAEALRLEREQIDEKLYFELFTPDPKSTSQP